jgi:hypothetical protein
MSTEATPAQAAPEEAAPTESPAETPVESAPTDPATQEAKPDEKPPEKKEALSPRLAAIAKAEAKLRAERDEFKKESEALKAERETLTKREALKKQNRRAWLKQEGVSYEELTHDFLSGVPEDVAAEVAKADEAGDTPKVLELLAQVKAMQDERAAEKQEAANRASAEYHDRVTSEVKAGGDKYELVLAHPSGMATVWALINEVARVDGKVLTPDEAASKVEAQLESELETGIAPLLKTKKGQAKLGNVAPKQAVTTPESKQGQPVAVTRTLTNSHAATAPPARPRELPMAERIALAKEELRRRG